MILAVDLGTSSAKAALFERDGACLAAARAGLRHSPWGEKPGQGIDPEDWYIAFKELLVALSAETNLGSLDCVVVSGQGPTLFPIGPAGETLYGAITWLDRRAVKESEDIEAILGRALDPAYNLPKALWFQRHLPEVYERTSHFSSCPEYVCARLSGVWATFLPAEGYQAIIWDEASLGKLGLDRDKFPPFVSPGAILGTVSPAASGDTGLPVGTPIVAGGPDFLVALLGTATVAPRRACDRSGTSEGINLCWEPGLPRDPRLLYMPHFVRPYENISGVVSTTGGALSWFMDKVEPGLDHEGFFRLAAEASPGAGSLLFLPYLSGERAPLWDPEARGAFIGLSLEHGRAELARAVAESAGFAMRDVIGVMESTGARIDELRATGRPSSNRIWNQIKADVTRKAIAVPVFREAELLGGLCLGLVALGDYAEPAKAAEDLVKIGEVFEPQATLEAVYDELFGIYRRSYRALRPVFGALTRFRRGG